MGGKIAGDDEEIIQRRKIMDEKELRDFLFSLAWYDCSAHHNKNVKNILSRNYPGVDFADILDEFERCKNMPPGLGCPR